jgi:hypothetical protein
MPAFYKIDRERKLVMSCGSGVLTMEDILAHQERLLEDPDFDPGFSQLSDFTQVTKINITPADVRLAARKNIFSSHSHRALVVKSDLQYGLGGMFEIHRDSAGEVGIRVFRQLDEALDWVLSSDTVSKDVPGV